MNANEPAGGMSVAALGAVGLTLCCGLSAVVSAAAGGITIAGLGLRYSVLAIAGLLVLVLVTAVVGVRRHRARLCPSADHPGETKDADHSRPR